MIKPLVIFGAGQIAEIAHYYFTTDTEYEVAAFTVDRSYLDGSTAFGLPLVAFEDVCIKFPPAQFDLFVAVSYTQLNEVRKSKFLAAKGFGYHLPSYISSRATVLNSGKIGSNCFILENNTIQPFASIGNNVTLWSGNHIGHHATLKDHCFIASHVVVSGNVELGESCFIGVNATLRDRIRVGQRCVIGAGALLLSNADAEGVYLGSATERSRVPSGRLRGI